MEDGNSRKNIDKKASMKASIPPLHPNTRQNQNNSASASASAGRRRRPSTSPPPISTSEQLMPIANVIRIMRKTLPPHAKISDEAKFAIQESVTEFISFVTEEANQRCRNEQRKTITGDDILCAMDRLGFDNYVDPLARYLQKYRDSEGLNHPRRQLIYRPSTATQRMGGHVPGTTFMAPTMSPNPNTNARTFAATGPSSSAHVPPPPAYVPNSITAGSAGLCSSLISRINFDAVSCSTHDEVEFDSIELPGDASSPTGSTSVDFMAHEDDSFDPFAHFK